MKVLVQTLTLGAMILGLAGASQAWAATVTVGSSTVGWDSPAGIVGLEGQGTGELRWGDPHPEGGNRKSGYLFEATASGTSAAQSQEFLLGTFTHENFAITTGPQPAIESASLDFDVTLAFDLGSTVREERLTFDWVFSHLESLNHAPTTCANGEANRSGLNVSGCADRVSFSDIQEVLTFEYAEGTVLLEILGFEPGTEFWTIENRTNSARLMARFTYEIAPIPLPAAGWLLLGALGGLALLRRRAAS